MEQKYQTKISGKNYVVKADRLRNFLYSCGFNFKQVPDRTGKQKYVWLFESNDLLLKSVCFYMEIHNVLRSKKLYTE